MSSSTQLLIMLGCVLTAVLTGLYMRWAFKRHNRHNLYIDFFNHVNLLTRGTNHTPSNAEKAVGRDIFNAIRSGYDYDLMKKFYYKWNRLYPQPAKGYGNKT